MRFLLYASILFAILPIVLMRPFFGLCIYYIVSLLQPKLLCWRGDFQDAMLVGVPLVIGAIAFGIRRMSTRPQLDTRGRVVGVLQQPTRSPLFEPSWQLIVLGMLVLYIAIARLFVPYPIDHSSYEFRALVKVLLVVALLTGLASDLRRYRILYIVIALATAFWAIKGGLKIILLGPHQVYGQTYDNNLFALVSVMALPMIFYFALSLRHARWRTILLICAALMCLGIIGSRSRAGFVAFVVLLLCMAWSSRYRMRAFLAVAMVAAVALTLAGGEIKERVVSIMEFRQDRSAQSRFFTWDVAQRLLADSPLIGVGFNNFELAKDRLIGGRKAAHSIFLQNLAELGLLGHPLWLITLIGTLVSMYRLMRRSRSLPPEMRWVYYWSRGLLLGLLAYCIHGTFHNEEYLELMFVLVGLAVSLKVTVRRELGARRLHALADEMAKPAASPVASRRGRQPRKVKKKRPAYTPVRKLREEFMTVGTG